MRPFKMFFGLAIGIMLFMFLARVFFIAFIVAAAMSIVYAIFRRIKDFITYDRYGEHYIKGHHQPKMEYNWNNGVEPLFQENISNHRTMNHNTHYIKTI